ncbi:MAG: type II secretion system protein GspG [Myxococcales bacterium]|nr:type II secretion system protein GspG [Myxococcales bacterium]
MKILDPGFAFVLGLIAVPLITTLDHATPAGRETTTRDRLSELDAALQRYHAVRGQYPPTGLEALRRPTPELPLVDDGMKFVDGWGRDLLFEVTPDGFLLASAGRDGALGTPDDLVVDRR